VDGKCDPEIGGFLRLEREGAARLCGTANLATSDETSATPRLLTTVMLMLALQRHQKKQQAEEESISSRCREHLCELTLQLHFLPWLF